MTEKTSLSTLVKVNANSNIVIGNSGSGKTYFTKSLLQTLNDSHPIFIFGNDENEWQEFINNESSKSISFFHDDPFESDYLFTLKECIIIFDDYIQNKNTENKLYKFMNYHVRHFNICFILITHSIFKSNLYSKILSAPFIFIYI